MTVDTTCPFCGQHHDGIAELWPPDFVAKDGDASLCTACGRFSVFDSRKGGGLRKPTRRERRLISENRDTQEARAAWEIVKRQRFR
jgi:hypothetical protein